MGKGNGNDCKDPKNTVWTRAALRVKYRQYFLVATGFADAPFSWEALLYGLHIRDQFFHKAPAISAHLDFTEGRMSDTYLPHISSLGGKVFAKNRKRLKKDTQVRFNLIGRKIAKQPARQPAPVMESSYCIV
jgi:hypothetical protein